MGISGGDRRPIRLLGGDRRPARLIGGDRAGLADTVAGGAVALEQLLAGGASSVELLPAGAGGLSALLAGGASSVDLSAAGGASMSSITATGAASAFRPSSVPEVAAGYFWDPLQATGSGSASFALPEGNGKTAANLITPSLAAAPTIGTINGCSVIQYTNRTAPSIDSVARNTAAMARGWTTATMLCGWFSMAAGPASVFGHWRPVNNFLLALGNTRIDVIIHDGTAIRETQHTVPASWLATPVYIEAIFDPSQSITNRLQLWLNRVQITPSSAASVLANLRDDPSFFSFSGTVNDGSGFNLSNDFAHGVVCHCRGIPSAANRDNLFNHRRLAA